MNAVTRCMHFGPEEPCLGLVEPGVAVLVDERRVITVLSCRKCGELQMFQYGSRELYERSMKAVQQSSQA